MTTETILVFDTETTGMWNFSEPREWPGQPHIVQLAFALFHDGQPVCTEAYLINSEFPSSPEAEAIHGKTAELRKKFGVYYDSALQSFLSAVRLADLVVAHNKKFDDKMIERGIVHCFPFMEEPSDHPLFEYQRKPGFCTMEALTPIMHLPGKRPGTFKWPKLIEAYKFLVDPAGFTGAHDAMADVMACAKIYFAYMEKLGQDMSSQGGPTIEEQHSRGDLP